MKILLLGKFPPLEGGVSGQTFWLTQALTQLGHSVTLVTNSDEAGPTYRQFHYNGDENLAGIGADGRLCIIKTVELKARSYIPFAQPFVTKLFGTSFSAIKEAGCDLILAWYFEPYGFVATLLGRATGLPVVIRHAGSDLGRLSLHGDLREAYRWMLESASGVITTNVEMMRERFGDLPPLVRVQRPRLPECFSSPDPKLDITELLTLGHEWLFKSGLPTELIWKVASTNSKPLEEAAFTIGAYGKIGDAKGSFHLVKGLASLASKGTKFAFLPIACGSPTALEGFYRGILNDEELARRTWILPPIAPWRIASYLQCCDVVCFLENGFPISTHGPLTPREILSSGACLVCSSEIAGKPDNRNNFVDNRNVVIVKEPNDFTSLASRLERLVCEKSTTKSIGLQGRQLSLFWESCLPTQKESARSLVKQLKTLVA